MSIQTATTALLPFQPAPCIICGGPVTRYIVSPSNPNGNAHRPFVRCDPCNEFMCFTDDRGIDPSNRACDCGEPSRMQVTGVDNAVPRAIHFVCVKRRCNYYSELFDDEGKQVIVGPNDLHTMIQERTV